MPIYGLYYSNLVHLFNGIYVRKLSNLNAQMKKYIKIVDENVLTSSDLFWNISDWESLISGLLLMS